MTACPDDAKLQQLLNDEIPAAESGVLEGHLEECARCRQKLDDLAGVASISAVASSARGPARVESPSLMLVMETLAAEGAHPGAPTPSSLHLNLEPTTKVGFLGKLGGIDIRRVIGHGGMGIVYEGVDPALNRTVAVKVLLPHLLGDPAAKERFVREAKAVAALSHANVVTIHAIAETGGIPYLVLQYVAGESLADLLHRDKKLSAEEMARIGAQVARGLAAAHAVGLVHRDIKPGNVLIEAGTGHVRITDFGLAKAIGGETITGAGTLPGTPAYMSPEQVSGLAVDARSDLFSLGVLLYQGVTGALPFAADSPFVVLDKIRNEKEKRLGHLDPSLPAWFCSIVERLLAKNPDQRVPTAAAVAEALEQRTTLRVPPSRWLTWAIAASALIAVLIAGYFVQDALRTPPPSPPVPPNPPGLVVPADPLPFAIVGGIGRFASLDAAIQAAKEGDIIEVHANGPYRTPKIEIVGTRLTIRAATGARPVFMPQDVDNPPLQWITSDRELSLIGLDVDWPVTAKTGDAETGADTAVISARDRLHLTKCRVVSGNRTACATSNGPITVDGCHLITDRRGGRCIVWHTDAELKMSQTALEGKSGLVVVPGMRQERATGEISDCTIRNDVAVFVIGIPQFKSPVALNLKRCLIDSEQVVTLFYSTGFPNPKKPNNLEMKTTLRKVLAWSESENVYRRKASYLASRAPTRPVNLADIASVGDWLKFWKMPESNSIEGDLHFHPRTDASKAATPPRLDRIDNPTGPVPRSVGIHAVGP